MMAGTGDAAAAAADGAGSPETAAEPPAQRHSATSHLTGDGAEAGGDLEAGHAPAAAPPANSAESAAPGPAARRRSSLQWDSNAREGAEFPGRVPQHDAEDDYEELLQVGQLVQ